ncbi:peptidoglycan DD-metalloendopeptidase family protein [Aliikangiella coralliicola]|uniref:Peptidoglycan DD-metalloendopeptidase family protein n=1 Tax=Aliikangiella coralliicola TaxID=2592383 RepID=A0A545UDC6_9GAMM|nr:peptidoglycan DD-metalloendopeptidase family protein [Aliikangiella coralliicola]TQV87465.1 peptidoglycan DD-metalloendopeptidase family protein [Aliikangiella coralliicola]
MRTLSDYGKLSFVIATLSGWLLGCSHNSPAPVYDLYSKSYQKKTIDQNQKTYQKRSSHSSNQFKAADSYVVKPGDTLFSIAWHHAVDYREVARINQLNNNLIYPGQKLQLTAPESSNVFDAESLLLALNREVLKQPTNIARKTAANKKASLKNTRVVRTKPASKKYVKNNSKVIAKATKVASVTPSSKMKKRSNRSRAIKNSSLNWIWPTDGKILEGFSSKSNDNRGLDIAGKRGQPVRASAPGRVVYEGSGLRGYGNLVIIKHDSNYLSAYAHNAKIYVSENEVVKAGQRIADIGSSGAQRDKLHFEIRYKGKPVDPLNYLPEKVSKKY